MTIFLFLGGRLDRYCLTAAEAAAKLGDRPELHDYVRFNAAAHGCRTEKRQQGSLRAIGHRSPSSVYIHKSRLT